VLNIEYFLEILADISMAYMEVVNAKNAGAIFFHPYGEVKYSKNVLDSVH
jgi:hypothetical protein